VAGTLRALLAALALLCALSPLGARAQALVVIDIDRVMREARVAQRLDAIETDERRALRDRLDALQRDLAAEETELTALRDAENLDRAEFERRVRAFDQKVRNARATAQESALAIERRFDAARATLRREVDPLIDALIAERGAMAAIDAANLLRAAPALDATDALIARLDAVLPAAGATRLLPQPTPPPPRGTASETAVPEQE
jgi:Skp family chaperone for outer membrane proteins